jgi:hypothetical protein
MNLVLFCTYYSQQSRIPGTLPSGQAPPYVYSTAKAQLVCLCLIRLVDPIAFTQIFPYINEMMAHLHLTNDPSRVGFYSGLAESAFSVFVPFSRFISGLVSLVRLHFFYLYISYIIDLCSRRNRTSARHFHWHSRCESGDPALWLTTDPPWPFTRAMHRSVNFLLLSFLHRSRCLTPSSQEVSSRATRP